MARSLRGCLRVFCCFCSITTTTLTTMAPIRLRHPKGVSTLQVDFDAFTVLDLQQEIFAVTEIVPSLQERTSAHARFAYQADIRRRLQ